MFNQTFYTSPLHDLLTFLFHKRWTDRRRQTQRQIRADTALISRCKQVFLMIIFNYAFYLKACTAATDAL